MLLRFAVETRSSKALSIADERLMRSIGESVEREDPTNNLLDVQTQLEWLRAIGFEDVDCYRKWLELALLIGYGPNKVGLKASVLPGSTY